MKKTTVILCVIALIGVYYQAWSKTVVVVVGRGATSSAVTRSDDFARSNENPLAGNWTTVTDLAAMALDNQRVTASSSENFDYAAYWNADSFAANQFSAVEATGTDLGVVVRVNGSACYLFRRTTGGTFQLWKMPGWTQLGSDYTSVSFSDGQVIRLEATGTSTTTLTPYVNGVALTAFNDGAGGADGDPITSGGVGLYCVHNVAGGSVLDNWTGGEL